MKIPIVEFENVTMSFDQHIVYEGISLKIFEGESVALIGPSGTGKTVLLKLILGIIDPTFGIIRFKGVDIATLDSEEVLQISRDIGMLFQGAALFDSLTVFENVAFPLREQHLGTEEQIQEIVADKLKLVGLDDVYDKFPEELSGGMKTRVGLARALAISPHILLLDEPTTGLDPTARLVVEEIIIKLRDSATITLIIVTHDMDSAHRVADRFILIADGRVQADGPADKLWNENKKVKDFVSGHWDETDESSIVIKH